ncbi:thioredoxin family protein [bacterium]|nr:thioredoxin family protein [bacterium]MBU1025321.1 thioredoxin family protein [bacterium]
MGNSEENLHRDPAQQGELPDKQTLSAPHELYNPPEEEYKSAYVKKKPVPTALNWVSLNSALKMISGEKAEKKAILYFASKVGCDECGIIEKEVFTDKQVLKNSRKWIFVKINYDVEKDLAEYYHVDSVPAFKAVSQKGNVYKTFTGTVNAEQFAWMLQDWY